MTSSALVLLYTAAVLAVLGAYLIYVLFSSVRWTESDLQSLERLELHLGQILRLLEAPDVGILFQDPESRYRLFLEFSENLKGDVASLVRSRKLDLGILALGVAFFFSPLFVIQECRLRISLRFIPASGR